MRRYRQNELVFDNGWVVSLGLQIPVGRLTLSNVASALDDGRIAITPVVDAWLAQKYAEMAAKITAVNEAACYGRLANAELKNGQLELRRLARAVPFEAEELEASLYDRMRPVKNTDLLLETDDRIGFTEAFTDLRNGVPPTDRRELMTVLLVDGIKKMADACPDYSN